MGVASGCGCKEVYKFPHITYPYSSCICTFFNVKYIIEACVGKQQNSSIFISAAR